MKLKLLALAAVLSLSGCVQPYGDVVPAESVGTIRAVGGTVSYSRANMQVSAESREAERRYAQEKANKNRQLTAMELDMIEQQRHSQEFDEQLRRTQKERQCAATAAAINDQVRVSDLLSGEKNYNKRTEQLVELQKHMYNKCMAK